MTKRACLVALAFLAGCRTTDGTDGPMEDPRRAEHEGITVLVNELTSASSHEQFPETPSATNTQPVALDSEVTGGRNFDTV